MARQPCPQNFDCLLMGAQKGRKCPNLEFCLEARKLGGNQQLPYYVESIDFLGEKVPDKCGFLKVKYQYEPERRELLQNFGWLAAEDLPYVLYFYEPEQLPILMVFNHRTDPETFGWLTAEDLPEEYFQWCAAKLSNNDWHEYKKKRKEIQNNLDWRWNMVRYEAL